MTSLAGGAAAGLAAGGGGLADTAATGFGLGDLGRVGGTEAVLTGFGAVVLGAVVLGAVVLGLTFVAGAASGIFSASPQSMSSMRAASANGRPIETDMTLFSASEESVKRINGPETSGGAGIGG